MKFTHILVTGGAGFVGSNLAMGLKRDFPGTHITAFDNLLRRGSELNLPRLREAEVEFVHGDIRCSEDLERLPAFDLVLECSAEPSVHAGLQGSPSTVIQINLFGTANCLEAARRRGADLLFLSSSRVYSIPELRALARREDEARFALEPQQPERGASIDGISEAFSTHGPRSFYGTTKLASELLIQEYAFSYGLRALVLRCGVLAGPWQMGRIDQGFVSLWVAAHQLGLPLRYAGFGGSGKQVRDVLHIDDLYDLVRILLEDPSAWSGRTYNVGGGLPISTSLLELTRLCQQITGRVVPIQSEPATSPVDIPIYISDCSRLHRDMRWTPRRSVDTIVRDLASWMTANEALLRPIFGSG